MRSGHSTWASWIKVAIVATTLAAVAFQISNDTERSLRKSLQTRLVEHLDSIVNSIELVYQQSIFQVESLSTRPEVVVAAVQLIDDIEQPEQLLASGNQRVIRDYLVPLRDARLIRNFYLVAPGNRTLATFDDADVGRFHPLTQQPQVLARAWTGETAISLPQESRPGTSQDSLPSRTVFSVTAVRDGYDTIQALLVLELDADATLYRALGHHDHDQRTESTLFDHRGFLLSDSRHTAQLQEMGRLDESQSGFRHFRSTRPDSKQLVKSVAAATSGRNGFDTEGYISFWGNSVVGAWQWLPRHRLGIALEIEEQHALATLPLMQRALVGLALISSMLVLLIAIIGHRQSTLLAEQVSAKTAALNVETAKLQNLFDQAPSGLIITDADHRITDFSLQAEHIFGIEKSDAEGLLLDELFDKQLRWPHTGEAASHKQIDIRRPDGETVPLEVSLSRNDAMDTGYALAIARDISDFVRVSSAMREEVERRRNAERSQRLLLDAAGEGIFGLDASGHITFVNPAAAGMLGQTAETLVGSTLQDLLPARTCEDGAKDELTICADETSPLETQFGRADGGSFAVEYRRSLLPEGQGSVVIFSDISARKSSESSLHLAESVFQHITEGVVVATPDGTILRVNEALCEMVGYGPEDLVGLKRPPYFSGEHPPVFYQQLWDHVVNDGYWEGEIWNRRSNGELFPTWQTIVAIKGQEGTTEQLVSVTRDITQQRRDEQRIHRLAYFDNLTGLPNRELFFDRFAHAIERAERGGRRLALLFLDLDRFKNVNDTLGHPIGDKLLVAVAERLQHLIRREDTIARLGGDEFTVLLESVNQQNSAALVAEKIVERLTDPFDIDDHQLRIGTSVGISLYPSDGTDATTLVKHADAAMYQAKHAGRSNYQFYSASLSKVTNEVLTMEAHLYRAIDNDEFTLHYQPQYTADGELKGLEALIRWEDPILGMIPPDRFIPIAEEIGLIVTIGEWVLHTACRQMQNWFQHGAPRIRLSVNLAGPQITRGDIVDTVSRVLDSTAFPAELLELEITETFIMDHVEQTQNALSALQARGVRIAIDDFGTGHSSLATLKRLPADTLKVDRAFVHDIPEDQNDMAIIRAILAMARELGLYTVAEGVETAAQKDFLTEEGCHCFQGFFFARPLPPESVPQLWQEQLKLGAASR